jgi:GrpB-like predicted nucleotidyltransferase (UPF0157 family)
MKDPIEVVPYSSTWPAKFRRYGSALRTALGDVALRIDHIGSTAVPGLLAKPVIDVQISVRELDSLDTFRAPLEELGLVFRSDNPDLTKRYFREKPGDDRTHIHVRRAGSWAEQFALLFRDFLRADEASARDYGAAKQELAVRYRYDRMAYTDAKTPLVWQLMTKAHAWSQIVGWKPGPSDA